MLPDGTRAETLKDIHEYAVEFFTDILGKIRGQFFPDLPEFLSSMPLPICTPMHILALSEPVTADIIKASLDRMPSSKTHGPDGFTAEFLKASWSVLGTELTNNVISFFNYPFMPAALNSTSLVLIQKRDEELQRIKEKFDLSPGILPIRYLGLPLCTRKLSIGDCDPLLAQIRKNLNSWSHRHLSLAGRYTLLTSVISGIVGFWTPTFMLPKKVIKWVNTLSNAFFWHGTSESARGAKVKWTDITFPKQEGGLGNGDDTFFWWDPWTPFGPLIHYLGQDGPSLLGIPLFSTVRELTSNEGWSLPHPRSEKQISLHAFVTTIQLSHLSDKPIWLIGDKVQKSFSSRKAWSEIRECREIVSLYSQGVAQGEDP
ncbi:unnamed protein product [Arabis nemorensis]|uniref:Reverse transcriptase zinc-binding domain-containing protein n=1 Tax=Arabis nemorensis TaxID=586526 RepID=A0A565BB30_9BRAS|nr:unnamed protein product [Arabis nemorensis]